MYLQFQVFQFSLSPSFKSYIIYLTAPFANKMKNFVEERYYFTVEEGITKYEVHHVDDPDIVNHTHEI